MKERMKTTLHSAVYFCKYRVVFFAFIHLCPVSVLFKGSSLTEMKFYKNFFPSLWYRGLAELRGASLFSNNRYEFGLK